MDREVKGLRRSYAVEVNTKQVDGGVPRREISDRQLYA
jgi:hypothetical protein